MQRFVINGAEIGKQRFDFGPRSAPLDIAIAFEDLHCLFTQRRTFLLGHLLLGKFVGFGIAYRVVRRVILDDR